MVLCICRSVTDREIDAAIGDGARSIGEVARLSGAGTDCGCCTPAIEQRLERAPTRCADLRDTAGTARASPRAAGCTNDCANCPRHVGEIASAAL